MGRIGIPKNRAEKRIRRHLRVRKSVQGTADRPRLVVFRSLKTEKKIDVPNGSLQRLPPTHKATARQGDPGEIYSEILRFG